VSSLLTCSRVPASGRPMRGSPWLPHALDVRLDTAWDPGEYPHRTPYRDAHCFLPGGQTRWHSPTRKFSGLNTFKVGSTRYLCTSPAFVPTHRCGCYRPHRKARYWARGARLPRRDSHPLEHAALPGRTGPYFSFPVLSLLVGNASLLPTLPAYPPSIVVFDKARRRAARFVVVFTSNPSLR